MRAPALKTVIVPEEAQAEPAALPEEPAVADEAAACTRSHTHNARTRKALRDAHAVKNLTRHDDDLFRKLGIKLGQE
ncbi:MAG: hypothetical protein ACP5XB_28780 [Isosphaeraceae bacterium]